MSIIYQQIFFVKDNSIAQLDTFPVYCFCTKSILFFH